MWAGIKSLNGNEAIQARQVFGTATVKVKMRDPEPLLVAVGGLSTKLRINFGGRILHIGYVDRNDQGGVYVELVCGEQTP